MAFAGVHHRQALGAPGREQLSIGLDGPAQLRHIVAEHLAEAARLEKIALHVDDQQRAGRRGELERIRFRVRRSVSWSFGHDIALMNACESATAPNTPPCILIILSAARWLP